MVTDGPLIGRESELVELEGMLARSRMVTVAGTGGCGKTRLALEHAGRLASMEHAPECAVAMLESVTSEEQLVTALLAAVGAHERIGSTPTHTLIDHVASRRMLLVLDNCEHLLAAAARMAIALLDGAPGVRLLTTSRDPLALDRESVLRLGPLSLPDADGDLGAVVRSGAGRLFVDRAANSNPAFALTPESARAVVQICRKLDGLPLALGLAAARLDTLTAEEVARSLAERGRLSADPFRRQSAGAEVNEQSRHGSVRASLDWSYRLLDEPEQALLRCLAVFSDGFTAATACAIAIPDADTGRVRGLLASLAAKGLTAPQPAAGEAERWTLLETVREYAAAQLGQHDEQEEISERHSAWFAAYARSADTLLAQPGGDERVEAERANLSLAFDYALAHDPPRALGIAASLMRHWLLSERYQRARSACSVALLAIPSGCDDPALTPALALVRCGAGLIGLLSEDYAGAIANTQTGLELLGDVQDPGIETSCLMFSSMVLIQTATDLAAGWRNAERAAALARAGDDPLGLAYALANLAVAATLCERFDTVSAAYDEFLQVPNLREHPTLRAWAEQAAAWGQLNVGSPERALVHIERALALEGTWPSMTHFQVLGFRIHALARIGRAGQALEEGASAMRRAQESGALQAVPAIELALMVAELISGMLDAADDRARRLLAMPHLHTLALARETLARVALMRSDLVAANMHADELEAIARRSGSARPRALADYIRGRAALATGETDRGRDLLHAALASCAELGLEREAVDVLDELALLDVRTGDFERAARLAGAAAATRTRLSCAPTPETIERMQAARGQMAGPAEDRRWEAAWAQGEALALADAIAYARRGRGPRDRPSTGWQSLTPAELDVAQLAAEGLTNPQIAQRMYVSRGTVKTHLSHVYKKLGVSNRVELTAAITARTPNRPVVHAEPQVTSR